MLAKFADENKKELHITAFQVYNLHISMILFNDILGPSDDDDPDPWRGSAHKQLPGIEEIVFKY